MTDIKSFDPRILATITTGVVLREEGFAGVPEAMSHIIGHDLWTHELLLHADAAKAAVLAAYPDMPSEPPADFKACAADVLAKFGPSIPMCRGAIAREKDIFDTFTDARDLARGRAGR